MEIENSLREFFTRSRQGKEDKPCFWTLHSASAPGALSSSSKPLETNLVEQSLEDSLAWLYQAIERHGPGQRPYFGVILKTSAQDNGVYMSLRNPHYATGATKKETPAIAGIGSNEYIGMLQQQMQQQMEQQYQMFDLRMQAMRQELETKRKIEELEGQIEYERTTKKGLIEKLFEKVEPHIEGLAGLYLQNASKAHAPAVAGSGAENDVDWRKVRDAVLALQTHFADVPGTLTVLVQILNTQPHLAGVLQNMITNHGQSESSKPDSE